MTDYQYMKLPDDIRVLLQLCEGLMTMSIRKPSDDELLDKDMVWHDITSDEEWKPKDHSDSLNETYPFDPDVCFPSASAACIFTDDMTNASTIADDTNDVSDKCTCTYHINTNDDFAVNTNSCSSITETIVSNESIEEGTNDKPIVDAIERVDVDPTISNTNNVQSILPTMLPDEFFDAEEQVDEEYAKSLPLISITDSALMIVNEEQDAHGIDPGGYYHSFLSKFLG